MLRMLTAVPTVDKLAGVVMAVAVMEAVATPVRGALGDYAWSARLRWVALPWRRCLGVLAVARLRGAARRRVRTVGALWSGGRKGGSPRECTAALSPGRSQSSAAHMRTDWRRSCRTRAPADGDECTPRTLIVGAGHGALDTAVCSVVRSGLATGATLVAARSAARPKRPRDVRAAPRLLAGVAAIVHSLGESQSRCWWWKR